jgi:hypothetical protein
MEFERAQRYLSGLTEFKDMAASFKGQKTGFKDGLESIKAWW